MNQGFYDYFKKRIEIFRNGMINGPEHNDLNKMDTLLIALVLEVAIREELLIEEPIEDENDQEENIEDPNQLQSQPIISMAQIQKISDQNEFRQSDQDEEMDNENENENENDEEEEEQEEEGEGEGEGVGEGEGEDEEEEESNMVE